MDEDEHSQGLPAPPDPPAAPSGFATDLSDPATSGRPSARSGIPDTTSLGRNKAGMLSLIGGLAVVIGVFLPWVSSTNGAITDSHNGMSIGTYGTLFLGAMAAAGGFGSMQRRPSPLAAARGGSLINGALILGLMALRWGTLQDYLEEARSFPGVTASIGPGVWLAMAGGLMVLAGGAMTWVQRQKGS